MNKEIERLQKGYCELKEKCNKGECDCTNEEYNNMCEANLKLYLEIERLNNIINKARKMIFDKYGLLDKYELEMLDDILKGVDKE